jgi:two-component system OmpR family response regulator
MRLLVVEDDDIVADAITRGLTAAQYAVHRVSSAEAAQSAMADEEFALAIIDVGIAGRRWLDPGAAPAQRRQDHCPP